MATKKRDIHGLCTWSEADLKALAKFKLSPLFKKLGIGAQAQDLFGEPPAVFVHTGDVSIDGSVLCDADGHGVFIIDGDLSIDGAFTFFASDAYTVLVVTGDLHAGHLHQARDTQLVVFGETTIAGLLFIDLSDAGFAAFRGPVTSKDRVLGDHVESGLPMFATAPEGAERSFDEPQEPEALHRALVRNKPPFAAAPRAGARKVVKATPEEIENMTVAEFFAGQGTTVVGYTGAHILASKINTGYLTTGKPTQTLMSLVLRDDTVVEAFPPTLAKVHAVEIWGYKDVKVLERVLRLLPQLAALEKLKLYNTAATALPSELGTLARLQVLELVNNKQLKALPPELGKLPKLSKLWIAGTPIESIPPALKGVVVRS